MILRIAWRNIWRNPVRSWIVIAALVVGMYAGVFSTTFMHGWMMQRLRAGIETETSHIQIHHKEFNVAEEIKYHFAGSDALVAKLEQIKDVKHASARIIVSGMVASAEKAQGVKVLGVDVERDTQVVDVSDYLVEGEWFEGVKRNPVVIGQKLADELKLKVRSKLVLRFQDNDGDFTGGAFRVVGVFKTVNTGFDERTLFVNRDDLRGLVRIDEDAAHEIVVRCNNPMVVDEVKQSVTECVKGLDVESWKEVSPELGYITETMGIYMYLFVVIILIALGFGIVNTMLMVVLERVREIGMLMAVGMKKSQIFVMILLETLMLSVLGGFIGVLLGVVTTDFAAKHGIDLSIWADGLSEMGFASVIYPEYNSEMVTGVAALVLLTGLVAAIYPAKKALKLSPSEALQAI